LSEREERATVLRLHDCVALRSFICIRRIATGVKIARDVKFVRRHKDTPAR
jgi:hypothetical protein